MENSLSLSKVVAGVMKWGHWGARLDNTLMASLIEESINIGVTTFDHADIYGAHTTEAEWGKAWKDITIDRDRIQLVTKCGIMYPSSLRPSIYIKHYDTSYDHIVNSVHQSLTNLNTDYIDLLLIHRPSPLMDPRVIAQALHRMKEEKKVLHFGVSNFTPSQVSLIQTEINVEVNQVELSPFALDPFEDGTLDQCMIHNIKPMAWSPLGGGSLMSNHTDINTIQMMDRMNAVAGKYGWDLDQMIYLFLLHHPSNIHIVVGSSKIKRITTAVNAVNERITDVQWFEILEAFKGYRVA